MGTIRQLIARRRSKKAYGFTDWGYDVAGNSVRALEQIIEMNLDMGERWTWMEDGGMHQLAKILYKRMKADEFPRDGMGIINLPEPRNS